MKYFNLTVSLLLIGSLFNGCQKSTPELVWFDEFNYSGQPDTTKWNYDLGDGCPNVCGWGNNEQQFYTSETKNIRVENGVLIIEAHKDSLSGKPFTSARIVTRNKGDWKYGRIEVRAKLPKGRGTWPAIWMLSTDWEYGGWPVSGEIDIMEHVGYDPGKIHGTIHTEKYNHIKQTQLEGIISISDFQDEFHNYGIEWRSDKIDFFLDNNLYHSVKRNPKDDYTGWPFDKRFHLIMNVAVGGNWGGQQGIDESVWPQKMEIDYVRIYK